MKGRSTIQDFFLFPPVAAEKSGCRTRSPFLCCCHNSALPQVRSLLLPRLTLAQEKKHLLYLYPSSANSDGRTPPRHHQKA